MYNIGKPLALPGVLFGLAWLQPLLSMNMTRYDFTHTFMTTQKVFNFDFHLLQLYKVAGSLTWRYTKLC